ncbi:MAG: lipid II flippase MurJ [Bdellovibrionota bacterium]
MWRTTVFLSLLSLLSQLAQLALQLVLARRFGTGFEVDAFVAASTGPNLFSSLLLAGAGQLLVPLLVREKEKSPGSYARARGKLLKGAFGVSILLALFLSISTLGLQVFAPGLAGPSLDIGRTYLPWTAAALPPAILSALLSQCHYAREKFLLPGFAGFFSTILVLSGFWFLSKDGGLLPLLYLQFAGNVFSALWLSFSEWREAPRSAKPGEAGPDLSVFSRRALLVTLGAASARVNAATDRFFASFLGMGGLSILHYADRWIALTQAVLSLPLVTVLYTRMSERKTDSDLPGTSSREALQAVLYLGLPLATWTWVTAQDLASFLLASSSSAPQDPAAPVLLALSLRAYAPVLALAGVGSVLLRAFYVQESFWVPTVLGGIVPMVLNVLLDYLVLDPWGVVGLAAVTSFNALAGLPVIAYLLEKKTPGVLTKELGLSVLRSCAASAFLFPLAASADYLLPGGETAATGERLLYMGILGPLVYLAGTRLLGSEEAREILAFRRLEAPPTTAPEVPAE